MNKIEQFYKDAKGEELTQEQKKENRFTYYDMIGFASAYYSKQLTITDVSQQRELLLAYHRYLTEELSLDLHEIWVDEHLKANNCG